MSLADLERFSKASPVVASLLAEGRTDSLKAAVSIAAACGYHFTVEEAQVFISGRPATAARHLTDEQLEKVTGGLGYTDDHELLPDCGPPGPLMIVSAQDARRKDMRRAWRPAVRQDYRSWRRARRWKAPRLAKSSS